MFSDFEQGGEMWAGSGRRVATRAISFDEPFKEPPVIHAGISMWDTDGATNQRMDLEVADVSTAGFTLVFRTWDDSRVARLRASWLAIGPVPHDDDWEID